LRQDSQEVTDDLILREKGNEKLYSIADPNWNVIAICDNTGDIQERYTYNAFGKRNILNNIFVAQIGSAFNWNRAFTGQVLDNETGLMLYRHRFYHVELGRFVSRDPIEFVAGDVNLHRYVGNMPHVFVDPEGFDEIETGGESSARCVAYSIPIRMEMTRIPIGINRIGPVAVQMGFKITAVASGRACKQCCNGEEKIYKDGRITGSIFFRIELTLGASIDDKFGNIFVKGYAGLRGEFGTEVAVSARYVVDECRPSKSGIFCVNPQFTGTIRGGISLRIGYRRWAMELGTAEAFIQANAGGRFCWKINADGGIEYDSSMQRLYDGKYTFGVRACIIGNCIAPSWTYSP
jgi:RHS repeat-associated protein